MEYVVAAARHVSQMKRVGGEVSINVAGKLNGKTWQYGISFSPQDGKVTQERLNVDGDLYTSDGVPRNLPGDPVIRVKYYQGKKGTQPQLPFESARPVLGQFARGNG